MKKSLNSFIIVFAIYASLSLSCSDRSSTISTTWLINKSGYKVEIKSFHDSLIVDLTLEEGESKIASTYSNRGKGNMNSFLLNFSMIKDSVVVIFDDSIAMVHCGTETCSYKHAYSYNSNRNIRNSKSYRREIKNDSKRHIENVYTYTFTPKDYADAKK